MRVLITGTSSGIGKAIAEKFLKEGFDVTGFDRKEASISQDSYTHFCLDIRDREQYPALAPFDIVINNAGVQNENDIEREPSQSQRRMAFMTPSAPSL